MSLSCNLSRNPSRLIQGPENIECLPQKLQGAVLGTCLKEVMPLWHVSGEAGKGDLPYDPPHDPPLTPLCRS